MLYNQSLLLINEWHKTEWIDSLLLIMTNHYNLSYTFYILLLITHTRWLFIIICVEFTVYLYHSCNALNIYSVPIWAIVYYKIESYWLFSFEGVDHNKQLRVLSVWLSISLALFIIDSCHDLGDTNTHKHTHINTHTNTHT